MDNEILNASYWEHYKAAKDLAMYLPLNHPKRVKIENELNNLIELMNGYKNKLKVTDHAVLRYIERNMEIDVDGIRDYIRKVSEIEDFLGGTYKVRVNGFDYVTEDYKVVTVIDKKNVRKNNKK